MRTGNVSEGPKPHSLRKKPAGAQFLCRKSSSRRRTNAPHKTQAWCQWHRLSSQTQTARHQSTEVPPRTAFRFLVSADIMQHHDGQTTSQCRELPRGSRQIMCESSVPPWSLGVRPVHSSSSSVYLLRCDLRSGTHRSRV